MAYPLVCPHCGLPLREHDRALRCDAGHSFDTAREGYVNLLVGKRPKIAGDSREMLLARRAIFDAGHFAPLAARLTERATRLLEDETLPRVVLDAGCGEGYYTGAVAAALGEQAKVFGADLSKEAARLAARRYPEVRFVVADTTRGLPFESASIGLLLNVFAPRNRDEFARLLAPGGHLLVVIPEVDHLRELRETFPMLAIETSKQEKLVRSLAPVLSLRERETLRYAREVGAGDAARLVGMGPSVRHLDAATRSALDAHPAMRVTLAFRLLEFER